MAIKINTLNYYVQSVLPTVFDDTLSYYELLSKVGAKLDEVIGEVNSYFSEDIEVHVDSILDEWYENGKLANIINNEVLGMKANQVTVNVDRFNAVGDYDPVTKTGTENIQAVKDALATMTEGGTLEFPKGNYLISGDVVDILHQYVTITGKGKLYMDYGFRPKESHFKADKMNMYATEYSSDCRAFYVQNKPVSGVPIKYLENFQFRDCYFENFFYAVNCQGGEYSVTGNEASEGYPVRDYTIENCISKTYTDKDAGHFQSIQVENVSYINNSTYGGQNATSYNAIKSNGSLKIIGNYDENNSYGSCEVENATGKAIVQGNTFKRKVWIDDSFDVIVSGNVVDDQIHITVGNDVGDSKNIIITGNVCERIRAEDFGTYYGGVIKSLMILGNTISGDTTHGIWIDGLACEVVSIADNQFTGIQTNHISVIRNAQLKLIAKDNIGNGGVYLITGSGGEVYSVDNFAFSHSGSREAFPTSHTEREFNGIRLTSANGTAYKLYVSDTGNTYTVAY